MACSIHILWLRCIQGQPFRPCTVSSDLSQVSCWNLVLRTAARIQLFYTISGVTSPLPPTDLRVIVSWPTGKAIPCSNVPPRPRLFESPSFKYSSHLGSCYYWYLPRVGGGISRTLVETTGVPRECHCVEVGYSCTGILLQSVRCRRFVMVFLHSILGCDIKSFDEPFLREHFTSVRYFSILQATVSNSNHQHVVRHLR